MGGTTFKRNMNKVEKKSRFYLLRDIKYDQILIKCGTFLCLQGYAHSSATNITLPTVHFLTYLCVKQKTRKKLCFLNIGYHV
jgi:hypothetical protein